ncbi:STAS domain-containing protein [Mesobacillus maritimus]|uniref:STAS domain-containing protein n=1 Tax=Mesobacillus maritimus TaxID=1643336 RepID=UPI00384B736A
MHKNTELYHFLKQQIKELADEWYETLDKSDPTGIYASSDPEVISTYKSQNMEFHEHFIQMFNMDHQEFTKEFTTWIQKIASDQQHLETPLQYIIREFMRTRLLYLKYINLFAHKFPEKVKLGQREVWQTIIIDVFDSVILKFTEETYKYSTYQLQAQQEMIYELSSPVISISNKKGLLPLVGEIDTKRAKMIIDNTLNQCVDKGFEHICIDLSGVALIDTMVAKQLFQLVQSLKLIGVKTTLSGIRPEIASTSVKLGLSLDDIEIKSSLAQALSYK